MAKKQIKNNLREVDNEILGLPSNTVTVRFSNSLICTINVDINNLTVTGKAEDPTTAKTYNIAGTIEEV